MVALLVRALLVVARAGVDQDGRAWGPYHRAVKRKDHQAAVRIQQGRLKPSPVPFDDLGCNVWMNGSRLEECGLELEHARDLNIAKAPAVCRAARRQHQESRETRRAGSGTRSPSCGTAKLT
jgi:hypothetical protein